MSIHTSALLTSLSIGYFRPNKADKKLSREVVDKHAAGNDKAARVIKRILPEEAVEPFAKIEGEARGYFNLHSVPWKEGQRMVAASSYIKFGGALRDMGHEFQSRKAKFLSEYPNYIEQAKQLLNGMFVENDYPSADVVADRFHYDLEFQPVPQGSDIRVDLAEEEARELRNDLNKRVESAMEEARKDTFRRLLAPVRHIAEKLKDEKGKFHDSLIGNLHEIVGLIPELNVAGDVEIDSFGEMIKATLGGFTAGQLRTDCVARQDAQRRAEAMAKRLADYV